MDGYDAETGRPMLKSRWPELKKIKTGKTEGAPEPPRQEPPAPGAALFSLPEIPSGFTGDASFVSVMEERRSRRSFRKEPLSALELSFLLYSTQGLSRGKKNPNLRTVPSGGGRHPFETYLFIRRAEGFACGLYRYLPLDHALTLVREASDPEREERLLDEALLAHNYGAGVTFLWVAAPERSEWSYSFEAHRLILLDAGHVCQNLYLACGAIGCGTCAVAAYDQELCDRFLGLDGKERFLVYAAPAGKIT